MNSGLSSGSLCIRGAFSLAGDEDPLGEHACVPLSVLILSTAKLGLYLLRYASIEPCMYLDIHKGTPSCTRVVYAYTPTPEKHRYTREERREVERESEWVAKHVEHTPRESTNRPRLKRDLSVCTRAPRMRPREGTRALWFRGWISYRYRVWCVPRTLLTDPPGFYYWMYNTTCIYIGIISWNFGMWLRLDESWKGGFNLSWDTFQW